jgi:hypothetical protein
MPKHTSTLLVPSVRYSFMILAVAIFAPFISATRQSIHTRGLVSVGFGWAHLTRDLPWQHTKKPIIENGFITRQYDYMTGYWF